MKKTPPPSQTDSKSTYITSISPSNSPTVYRRQTSNSPASRPRVSGGTPTPSHSTPSSSPQRLRAGALTTEWRLFCIDFPRILWNILAHCDTQTIFALRLLSKTVSERTAKINIPKTIAYQNTSKTFNIKFIDIGILDLQELITDLESSRTTSRNKPHTTTSIINAIINKNNFLTRLTIKSSQEVQTFQACIKKNPHIIPLSQIHELFRLSETTLSKIKDFLLLIHENLKLFTKLTTLSFGKIQEATPLELFPKNNPLLTCNSSEYNPPFPPPFKIIVPTSTSFSSEFFSFISNFYNLSNLETLNLDIISNNTFTESLPLTNLRTLSIQSTSPNSLIKPPLNSLHKFSLENISSQTNFWLSGEFNYLTELYIGTIHSGSFFKLTGSFPALTTLTIKTIDQSTCYLPDLPNLQTLIIYDLNTGPNYPFKLTGSYPKLRNFSLLNLSANSIIELSGSFDSLEHITTNNTSNNITLIFPTTHKLSPSSLQTLRDKNFSISFSEFP